MLRVIFKIIANQNPSHIVFVFDKTRNTFRRDLYPDYKANRKETLQPLKEQFIAMQDILSYIGFQVLISDKYEADDLAGSIAKKFESEIPVRLLTKDHDYLQLITDNTYVWMIQSSMENAMNLFDKYGLCPNTNENMELLPDKVFEFNEFYTKEEFGVNPIQIIDLKAIQGDASDNIPGISGIKKPAIPLLNEYGTLEGIYQAIESNKNQIDVNAMNDHWKNDLGITRNPLQRFLATGSKDIGLLSKELATIVTNILITQTLDDFKTSNLSQEALRNVFESYEFKSLLSEMEEE